MDKKRTQVFQPEKVFFVGKGKKPSLFSRADWVPTFSQEVMHTTFIYRLPPTITLLFEIHPVKNNKFPPYIALLFEFHLFLKNKNLKIIILQCITNYSN